ncbi:hypothetical protein CsSME_00026835 [Camellia sinensis var. sinensis]
MGIAELNRQVGLNLGLAEIFHQYSIGSKEDGWVYYLRIRRRREKIIKNTPDKDLNDDDFFWVSGNFEDHQAQIPGRRINWKKGEPDSAHLHSLYSYPNLATLRAALRYPERSWAKLLKFEPTYRYSGRRKARVTDFLLEEAPEPDPTLPEIRLIPLTAEEEMAKRNRVRALLTETNRPEVPPPSQTQPAVVALRSQQPSSSRPSKRARSTPTEQHLVDKDKSIPSPIPQSESSDRAGSSRWAPKLKFQNRFIQDTDSVVAEKDHLMAFNLAKSVCLPADMEHHQNLTELKAIRSATKSMILKSQIAHQKVLELRKTTRQALAEVEAKATELKESHQKTAELEAEVARLSGLVTSAEVDKQKALIVMKDKYLRELVKLEGKKNAEIAELKKKVSDANAEGFKEAEGLYIPQCEGAKDLFFKCGWRSVVEQLGCGPETEGSDDDQENEPTVTPVVNEQGND